MVAAGARRARPAAPLLGAARGAARSPPAALALALKDLEAAGLVRRTVTDDRPPQTRYEATDPELVARRPRRSRPGRRPRPAGRRRPRATSVPPSSSRTSASTIERPVPRGAPAIPAPSSAIASSDVAVPLRELDPHRVAAVLERVLQQLGEDERERRRPVARRAMTDASDAETSLPAAEPLDEHRAQPLEQLAELDVSSRRSVSTSCTAAIARIRLTESSSARRGVDAVAARLQPQQRRDRLQVVLDPVVDLLGEHAAHHRAPVLERDRRVVGDRGEQRPLLVGERRVAVGDELADLRGASSGAACRTACSPGRPSGHAILPSSSTSAAPVAETASIVVLTIASSDSSR